MTVEKYIFKEDFAYDNKMCERLIHFIQITKNEHFKRKTKEMVFKMMKDVVRKNVSNYLNLLRNTNQENIPTRDEVIANSFIMFDKCVEKFACGKNYNFYFYFNKTLSRGFFRMYQKELVRNNNTVVQVTEKAATITNGIDDDVDLHILVETIGLTSVEQRICYSKLRYEKSSEFLAKNKDVTSVEYTSALHSVKAKIAKMVKNKQIEK